MPKRGKKYQEVAKLIDRNKLYSPQEAIELAKKTVYVKFDPSIEVHMRLGVDPRHADQQVRSVVLLPHGLGKEVRVLVFAEGEDAKRAEEAGADFVGSDELIKKIQNGWTDFDVALAVPYMMGKIGRSLGKILGPRGLMPNPKAGTIVQPDDLPRMIKEAKMGRVEFRVDRTGNIHVPIGKASFPTEKLLENMAALMEAVKKARPPAAKGQYIRRVTVANSMGPGIKVDPIQAQALETA